MISTHQQLGHLADPQQAPHEPAAIKSALQEARGAVEEIREAHAWSPAPGRREVPRENSIYIKPRRPRLNGKVERSHRIDEEEFYRTLKGVVIDDTKLFNEKLKEREGFYNYQRHHSALGGMTPYDRWRVKVGLQA
jgi:hypothetical protein